MIGSFVVYDKSQSSITWKMIILFEAGLTYTVPLSAYAIKSVALVHIVGQLTYDVVLD